MKNTNTPEMQKLLQLKATYQLRKQQCADIIKQLCGTTPDGFTFTFSIAGQPIVVYEIGEDEGNFTLSHFMAWHAFYDKKLLQVQDGISEQYPDGDMLLMIA